MMSSNKLQTDIIRDTSASETATVHSVSNAISAKHTPLIVIHSFIKIKSILCFYQFCCRC